MTVVIGTLILPKKKKKIRLSPRLINIKDAQKVQLEYSLQDFDVIALFLFLQDLYLFLYSSKVLYPTLIVLL